jgi:hypothetical protein
MFSNEPLNVVTLTVLPGVGAALGRQMSGLDKCIFFAEVRRETACVVTAVYVQNYTSGCIVVK